MKTIKNNKIKKYLLCLDCDLDKGLNECPKCGVKKEGLLNKKIKPIENIPSES